LTADASRTAIHDWFKRINKFWQLTDLAVPSAMRACLNLKKFWKLIADASRPAIHAWLNEKIISGS
jgi:hypothetical protein